VVKDATPFNGARSRTVGHGEARDSDVRGEIFKAAVGGIAVNSQISSTRAVDGHVVRDLKFPGGQGNGAGDAGGVNCVSMIRDRECLTQ